MPPNLADDNDFNPDDMSELEGIFANMISDNESGFVMEFIISKADAKEMSICWAAARRGDKLSIAMCLSEFGKIVSELEQALRRDN